MPICVHCFNYSANDEFILIKNINYWLNFEGQVAEKIFKKSQKLSKKLKKNSQKSSNDVRKNQKIF